MDRSKRARCWITEEERHAVGRLDTCEHTGSVAEDRIAVNSVSQFVLGGLRVFAVFDDAHVCTMDLPTTSERPIAGKKLEKPATILQNVLRFVFIEPGEAQRSVGHWAHAAETSGEAIYKTILLERFTNEGSNSF
jgi:hypothetical protein